MLKLLEKLTNKLFLKKTYNDFDKSNPLGGGGERVDIIYHNDIKFETLDIYQKSHYRRYEYALNLIASGSQCGDFACGTGYGSVMIAQKAKKVIAADIDSKVIRAVKKRYKEKNNIDFQNKNLLKLDLLNTLDTIISFETIEHFSEKDIIKLLNIYNKALIKGGKLIFSVPYKQEKTESATKMGFHLTFRIDEERISQWLSQTGFALTGLKYQDYDTHTLFDELDKKDFIICVAQKK